MQITIEGESLHDIEEKIIATARDIKERRLLLSEGCTCDLSQPRGVLHEVAGHRFMTQARCTEAFAFCDSRRLRHKHNAAGPHAAAQKLDDLAEKMDGMIQAYRDARLPGTLAVEVTS